MDPIAVAEERVGHMGLPVYERMGYRTVCEWYVWSSPAN